MSPDDELHGSRKSPLGSGCDEGGGGSCLTTFFSQQRISQRTARTSYWTKLLLDWGGGRRGRYHYFLGNL